MSLETLYIKTKSMPTPPEKNAQTAPLAGMIFFQIKPFKDNDRTIGHWDTLSKNLINLKRKKIVFMISGNASDIKMYVGIPKKFKTYFTNTFFASYPTSDLIEVNPIKIPENRNHIHFSRRGKFLTKEEFTRDGTYMDPISPLFALFTPIDPESRLTLYFSYTFRHPRTLSYIFTRLYQITR